MLKDVGMPDDAVGDVPQSITSPEFLGSGLVRGRAVNMHTIVKSGLVSDRQAVVTIEGIPTSIRQDAPDAVMLQQMMWSEGSATAASTSATTRSAGFIVGLPGLLLGRVGVQAATMANYGHTRGSLKGETLSLTPTTGRLRHGTHERVEYTGDMVWRVTVTVRDKNMVKDGPLDYRSAIVKIGRGISFLRQVESAPDPETRIRFPTTPA